MNRVREIVKASYAHGAHIYGAGSCIAILDSGISPHPDFSGRIIGWHDVLSSTRQPYDDYGHGTHVAGIAAGSGQASRGLYRGIAPRADLVAVKVLNRYGEGTVENICTGIDWVLRNRMRYGINIVNISAGTAKEKQFDESSPLVRKVEELWDAGLVVVVSAGNRGPEAGTISAPGNSRKVITVGSSDDDKTVILGGSRIHNYSGRGPTRRMVPKPDIVAPGSNIISCSPPYYGKTSGYTARSGTSMATPIVSGAAALFLNKYPDMTNEQVKYYFQSTATDLHLPRNQQGYGLLNIERLLSASDM